MQELGAQERRGCVRRCCEKLRFFWTIIVAASTNKSYEGAWQLWLKWTELVGKDPWIVGEAEEAKVVEELAEFMAYSGAKVCNKESTLIAGELVAVLTFSTSSLRGGRCHRTTRS